MLSNKNLIKIVGLLLIIFGMFGCSDIKSSTKIYAYIPSNLPSKSYQRIEVKSYQMDKNGVVVKTTDGRTFKGFNITVEE